MIDLDSTALRAAYSRFLAKDRVLLTGHSHQAWPDVVRDALGRFFDDSAEHVDGKWYDVIFPKIDAVGRTINARMGFDPGDPIAFGRSTQELVFRLLTCLPIFASDRSAGRARIVTTTSEFHSLRRQLSRLAEEGFEVVWVDAQPREALPDRLLAAITPGTTMVALSSVFFDDAYVVPRLDEILSRAAAVGAIPLVDVYHSFNVAPIDWGGARDQVYVTAGSYKYAGFGEGLCWLRFPRDCALRPVDTGWYADFGALGAAQSTGPVTYGSGGARFAGSTFDASALYRAEAALAHWDRFGLTVPRLRAISLGQTRRILDRIDARGLGAAVVSSRDDDRRGGFVTVRVPRAAEAVDRLRARGVFVDSRRDLLRIGPAPYLLDEEIDRGVDRIADVVGELARG
jgi:kynureninase